MAELDKIYDPKSVEGPMYQAWLAAGAFHADPAKGGKTYTIVIPPPNVTAALHLGHALNNTLQDIMVRWKRMAGFNTLWMPGTDHAGIATQTVVEKRILAQEGKRRTDFGRDEFIARIQKWKDEYETRILGQLKSMGCSCDWERTRFTMDEQCAKAVRAAFFKLFSDGLIYRGKRLVNWDPATQTVLADDEVEHETVNGHFYYLKYPLVDAAVRDTAVSAVRATGVSPVSLDVAKRKGAYLPHWTKDGGIYAVNFRLADCLPRHVLKGWLADRDRIEQRAKQEGRSLTRLEEQEIDELFSTKVESFLDAGQGECILSDSRVAQAVSDALGHFDGERYRLLAWSIMPNHVHVVLQPLAGHELGQIIHSWKSFTAHEANKLLSRQGELWAPEYFDHLLRDEDDLAHAVQYAFDNAAHAGLENWRWQWIASDIQSCLDAAAAGEHGRDARGTHGRDAHVTGTTYITVATTRPETMLGDTAIAINPRDPRAAALRGKKVRLPIVGREIPIIEDEYVVLPDPNSEDAKARFATGFLKVTPAHDPNDYEIGRRHNLPVINVLAPDGSISDKHGWDDCTQEDAQQLVGLDRFEAREAIVEWFREEGLLEEIRDYAHEVGHSYRSHVPIEPYLSDQWFVAVKKPIPGIESSMTHARLKDNQVQTRDGVVYLKDTDVPVDSLAGLALIPLLDERLEFVPSRYANNFRNWLENLRDWPISRQLWWGHQIPVWVNSSFGSIHAAEQVLERIQWLKKEFPGRVSVSHFETGEKAKGPEGQELIGFKLCVCIAQFSEEIEQFVEKLGFTRDPDVLDTWFSSGLWPISTMGWPEQTDTLKTFYPTSVLCTAREIITLWVSRMVMFGQYFQGDIPFSDVYIHAMIQDGQGRKMSKSLGNGIDPLDIIESHGADAMRFTLAYMTTETQDVRMPVEEMTLPDGRKVNASPKFDVGRNFCNKLWTASRFAMMNIAGAPVFGEQSVSHLADAWILSRLNATIRDATAALEAYRFHEAAEVLYRYMWNDFCDWYLEIAKSRINAGETRPKSIVAMGLDMLLRLLHPMIPFITEAIWQQLNIVCPYRVGEQGAEELLIKATWPRAQSQWINPAAEAQFAVIQQLIGGIREIRNTHNVPPSVKLTASAAATGADAQMLLVNSDMICALAGLEKLTLEAAVTPKPSDGNVLAGGVQVLVHDVVDPQAELAKLKKRQETLAKGVAGAQAKLGNENFLSRAKPDVIAREKERLSGMQDELAAVEKALKLLL